MRTIHDQLYEVLAERERRQLLFSLLTENPKTDSLVTLDSPPDAGKTGERKRIEYEHVHLPKLDNYGFIEWTPNASCVERGPRFDEIRPLLEALSRHHEKLPMSKQPDERQ